MIKNAKRNRLVQESLEALLLTKYNKVDESILNYDIISFYFKDNKGEEIKAHDFLKTIKIELLNNFVN